MEIFIEHLTKTTPVILVLLFHFTAKKLKQKKGEIPSSLGTFLYF